MKKLLLASVAALALFAAAAAAAAPSGPEGPGTCTFANGITTCAHVGAPVVTETTSAPDELTGCTTTTVTTATTTTYTAHHGTYNSHGSPAPAPADATTTATSSSEACPKHGSVALFYVGFNDNNCGSFLSPSGEQVGTAYWYEDGSDVHVHLAMTSAPSGENYDSAVRCRAFIQQWGMTSVDGGATTDTILAGYAGRTVQFDFEAWHAGFGPNEFYLGSGSWYAVSPFVTL